MKPKTRKHLSSIGNIAWKYVAGPAWQHVAILMFPAVIAIGVGRSAFLSLGDFPLSVVLGCTAFIIAAPFTASIDEHSASGKHNSR